MKTRLTTLLTVIAFVAFSHAASAAAAGNVAVLNLQTIMRDSAAAKSIKDQLDKKQKSFQSELSSKESQLQKEEQELAKQRNVLAQDAFEQKVKDFKNKAGNAQRDMQAKKAQLDKAFGQALGEVQKSVTVILEAMAKERGFSVVIPTQQILYSDPSLDITQDVLSKLNKSLPTVSVKF